MTVNCSASVLLAMYLAIAQRRGISWQKLGGTIQNDMLKEFIAQKEWISPPEPSVRIVADMIEFCAAEAPRWHAVSISGYHIREAGSTAVQELAFTLADGIAYVEEVVRRGRSKADDFGHRLSFFFDVHNDFLEEIAKLRAARRLWAKIMRERFGATRDEACRLRMHAQTAGVTLTAQQPLNNVVRVDAAGAGRRSRRRAVAAHELVRRDARAAHRGVGDGRAAHAADHRRRERRREHGRSARRQLRRRGAHRRDREGGLGRTSPRSIDAAAWSRRSSRATRSSRSRRPPIATSSVSIVASR